MEKSLSPGLDLWRRDIEESIAVKQRVLADDTLLRRTMRVAQLMAEGIDPDDPQALEAWLAANRQRLGDDS